MNIKLWLPFAFACAMPAGVKAQDNVSAERGKMVYEQSCLACHQADGSGVPFLAPPLIEGTFVNGDKKKLIGIVIKGMQDVEIKGESYANPMPAFDYLTDEQIADVLTYVRSNFKNKSGPVVEADVKEARSAK
jgi:mono/diheme cytochrome c family protein